MHLKEVNRLHISIKSFHILIAVSFNIYSGHEKVVRLLIKKGAKINSEDVAGSKPLDTAISSGKLLTRTFIEDLFL